MKKVLLTNIEIVQYSGSEINCITIAKQFKKIGYEVYIGALDFGEPLINEIQEEKFNLINLLEEKFDFSSIEFDILWIQHSFLLDWLIFDKNIKAKRILVSSLSAKEVFESLPLYANDLNMILANSIETKNRLQEEKMENIRLFENYSFEEYFSEKVKVNALKNIAVVSNHIPEEEKQAITILKEKGYNVDVYGLEGKKVYITDKVLKNYDVVITIGKTVQYCMSLQIPVYIYDIHGGPGYLNMQNIEKNREKNFSGRGYTKKTKEEIVKEIEEQFLETLEQEDKIKEYAYENFCFERIFKNVLKDLEETPIIDLDKIKEDYNKLNRNIMLSKKITNYIIGRYNKIINYKEENIKELKNENERLYKELLKKDQEIIKRQPKASKLCNIYVKLKNKLFKGEK